MNKHNKLDDDGDAFRAPAEYAPMQDMKERFLGVPGTLRFCLMFHINN
ncbi:hypothetical protein R83H12_02821 [Fibrobacteria bacterium R8-3-H12]